MQNRIAVCSSPADRVTMVGNDEAISAAVAGAERDLASFVEDMRTLGIRPRWQNINQGLPRPIRGLTRRQCVRGWRIETEFAVGTDGRLYNLFSQPPLISRLLRVRPRSARLSDHTTQDSAEDAREQTVALYPDNPEDPGPLYLVLRAFVDERVADS